MLYACLNVYEEEWTLARCIRAIRKAAPHACVVVVDGAYADFPHPAGRPESGDATLGIAARMADRVIRCPGAVDGAPRPWRDEIEKRNAYLIGMDERDWYLVVDADEELLGNVPARLFVPEQDVLLQRDDGTPAYGVFRLFQHREGLRYRGAHNALWAGDRLLNRDPRQLAKGFFFKHYYVERYDNCPERMKRKGRYYEKLSEAEAVFRRANRMV